MRLLDLSENELEGVLLSPAMGVPSLGRLSCTCKLFRRAAAQDGVHEEERRGRKGGREETERRRARETERGRASERE